METYKRRWTWTKKELGNTKGHKVGYRNAPKYYRKPYNKSYRVSDKRALFDELNGRLGQFVDDKKRRTESNWDYW